MADIEFQTFHGCACGQPGQKVARRNLRLITREWEVDVIHSDGKLHTNYIVKGQC